MHMLHDIYYIYIYMYEDEEKKKKKRDGVNIEERVFHTRHSMLPTKFVFSVQMAYLIMW